MTGHFESSLIEALGKIADRIETLSFDVESLTMTVQQIWDKLEPKDS